MQAVDKFYKKEGLLLERLFSALLPGVSHQDGDATRPDTANRSYCAYDVYDFIEIGITGQDGFGCGQPDQGCD